MSYEVPQPILNSPFEEPAEHWYLDEGQAPERRPGRRPAGYFYRDPKAPATEGEHEARGKWQEFTLVNLIRRRIKEWRKAGYPGVTRTTLELFHYWQRDGRKQRQDGGHGAPGCVEHPEQGERPGRRAVLRRGANRLPPA